MLENAWIIPLIPAASFLVILLFGKRLQRWPRQGGELGIAAVGIAFLLALVVNVQWFGHVDDEEHEGGGETTEEEHALAAAPVLQEHGEEGGAAHEEFSVSPYEKTWTWWQSGGVEVTVGMFLDGPSVMMLFVVTLVSLLVHVYSTDYVRGDRRYTHYFAFLSLFTASMLGLVISENTLQLLVCWELVGLCSFVLIGHWWEEKPNSDAALKAFITNRVGDVGLICGVIILFFGAGQTFSIETINEMAVSGEISHLVLLVAACSLIAAVMSKSGQFILHTWLPDAMAGPTPVSALIHAATMVVAGIFMVSRLYPVFFQGLSIGTSSVNLLAVVGAVTVIGGAGLAFVQADIKKVLAYSTVSQLGYMVMALGVGAWTAALFHLFTHAFFKAGLFLGSGSVAHAVHSFDMKQDMGGLKRFMPKTFICFGICTLALVGLPPLAGFWSKDEILASAQQLGMDGFNYKAFLIVGAVGAFMTAAYMTRCVYLTFFGEPRGHAADAHHPPHESGPWMLVPIYVLTGLAVISGLANWPFGDHAFSLRFEHFYEPKGEYFPSVLPSFEHPEFDWGVAGSSVLIGLLGLAVAYAWFFRGQGPHGITERNALARAGYRVLEQKYYFDWLYTDVIVRAVKGPIARAVYWFNQRVIDGVLNAAGVGSTRAGRWVYDIIDQGVVDGAINGSGAAAQGGGQVFRRIQTGKVQQYGSLLFGAAALLAGLLIVIL
jgi:NADH-quinone oxidoreductase subunit L